MASGFFALLDDIAVLMDDVAAMSKIAAKKTAGILGDDLAVNAEKASGFVSSREIPVLWAISKGSFFNKLIILPIAFLLSAFLPWAIISILLLGGIYLAYEGAEKIYEYLVPHKRSNNTAKHETMDAETVSNYEKKKIKSAIITDFILSVEIIIIALSTVVEKQLSIQIMVVSIVAIIATIGVYGIVALIVRMDDFGYKLMTLNNKKNSIAKKIGVFFVNALPIVIKSLAVIGTIAMILVAGGIYIHNIHFLNDFFQPVPLILGEFIVGLIVGLIALFGVKIYKRVLKTKK
ncbi:putative membrane protein [hydrothermal vent metagenome]|uniref:Putative membrane protein n=1 Tax=hydrothermal vent metagenome TaxID=652676 RepID=A0A3B0QZN4_9ZZZZ